MGGRGSYLQKGGFKVQDYKVVDIIAGIKVLSKRNDKNKSTNLPTMSNTPGTMYMSKNKRGYIKQLRIYGNDRRAKIDIDFDHKHKGMQPHIHFYKGGRENNVRELTKKDIKKYGKILKEIGVDV